MRRANAAEWAGLPVGGNPHLALGADTLADTMASETPVGLQPPRAMHPMRRRPFALGTNDLTPAPALNAERGGPIRQVEQAGRVQKERFDQTAALCLVHGRTVLRVSDPPASQARRVGPNSGGSREHYQLRVSSCRVHVFHVRSRRLVATLAVFGFGFGASALEIRLLTRIRVTSGTSVQKNPVWFSEPSFLTSRKCSLSPRRASDCRLAGLGPVVWYERPSGPQAAPGTTHGIYRIPVASRCGQPRARRRRVRPWLRENAGRPV